MTAAEGSEGQQALSACNPDGRPEPAARDPAQIQALIDRHEAPVKQEYVRQKTDGPVSGPRLVGGAAPHKQPEPPSSGGGGRGRARGKQQGTCQRLLMGKCSFGPDKCKFSHDIAAILAARLPDLPGQCPNSSIHEPCPYGIACRWATSHTQRDELHDQLRAHLVAAAADQPAGLPAGQPPPSQSDVPDIVPMVAPPGAVQQPANTLSKDVQQQLWKRRYNFSKSTAILKELGLKLTFKDNNSTSGQAADDGAGAPSEPGPEPGPPSPKRARVEEGADGAAAAHVEVPLRREEKRVIDFRGKTVLAPLTTVGNLPFRRVCKLLGADVTVGEMALCTNLLQGQASEWALLKRHPCEDLFGVQIAGGYPDAVARTCQLIDEATTSVDYVDINMGCPIDLVCDRGAGSALLLKPRRITDLARAADRAMSLPLTLKTRKGYYDGQDVTHTFVDQIRDWGPCALTLHGRTRQQRYSRAADWDYIRRCAEIAAPTGLQLIGNGDVFSFQDWEAQLGSGGGEATGVVSCMIGRGALIKPWIFTEVKERRHWDISAGERLDLLRSYCQAGLEHWGSDTRGVDNTRRFLLEWLSYTHRYVPVGLLEVLPQCLHWRVPPLYGRSDLETLLASDHPTDWIRISEMFLGPSPAGFKFTPKHKSTSYAPPGVVAGNSGAAAADGDEQDGQAEG